jgi:hypothetical protein
MTAPTIGSRPYHHAAAKAVSRMLRHPESRRDEAFSRRFLIIPNVDGKLTVHFGVDLHPDANKRKDVILCLLDNYRRP